MSALLMVGCGEAWSAIINVPADQPTIAAAIAAAAPSGDEIVVAPGIYLQTGTLDPGGKTFILRSSGGPLVTTIQGSGAASTRVFNFRTGESPAFVLDGFTITGGTLGAIRIGGTADGFTASAPPSGNPGASPTIRNCIFEGNSSASSDGGAITIGVSDVSGFNIGHSTPLIENCIFRNNTGTSTGIASARGGAVNISGGAPTIRNCTFTNNNSNRAGGAIGIAANSLIVPNLTVTIEGCTFSANTCGATSASAGGCPGIHIAGRNVDIINCVIENHTYTGTANVGALAIVVAGSAVATPPYTLNLINTVIRNNYASGTTGAPYRPVMLVVTPATVSINGGGFISNGFRAGDNAELGFNKGIEFAPAAPETAALVITNAAFTGNSTSATTPVGNTALITGRAGSTPGAGGIFEATITNTTFTNNKVSAIFLNNGAGDLSIAGGSISGSTGGAAMIVANPIGALSINGTSFTGNSGLVNVSGATSPTNAGTFELNGVSFSGNSGTITASNFTSAAITGGSISGNINQHNPINLTGSGEHSISGLSLTNNSLGAGGSLRMITSSGAGGSGTLSLSDLSITNNTATGGSITLVSASDLAAVTVAGCEFSGNDLPGSSSGVLALSGVGTATISGSTFNCVSSLGVRLTDSAGSITDCAFTNAEGGIEAASAMPLNLAITRCTFIGGTINGGGPTGINIADAVSTTIRDCRLLGNSDGGIGLAGGGSHTIINALIAGGTGNNSGAITLSGAAAATIINCTITGNSTGASGSSGGLTLNDSASATVVNSILYGNTAPEIDDAGTSGAAAVSFSNIEGGFIGANNIDATPSYLDPDGADNAPNTLDDDYRLVASSAGVNSGSNASVPSGVTTDLAGQPRIVATVDMGAYEFQPPACPADFNNSGVVTVQDIFDYLAAYFSSNPAADFNGSGAITVQDIFDFLAAYFTPCP